MMTQNQILVDFKKYIAQHGNNYGDWYTGIATDPRERLFVNHNVNEHGVWIYAECANHNVARDIEKYFLDVLGTRGGDGGGSMTSRYVYCYKITSSTVE